MSTFTPVKWRLIAINYMINEIIDEGIGYFVRRELIVGRYTYCESTWSNRWTRSKQKAFEDWVEYMEEKVDEASAYNPDNRDDDLPHVLWSMWRHIRAFGGVLAFVHDVNS